MEISCKNCDYYTEKKECVNLDVKLKIKVKKHYKHYDHLMKHKNDLVIKFPEDFACKFFIEKCIIK